MKTKIYIIEDSEVVKGLLKTSIKDNFDAEVMCISNPFKLMDDLLDFEPDIVILDYNLRIDNMVLDAQNILIDINEQLPNAATIIFSGQNDKDLAVELIKKGAVNYVYKGGDLFHEEMHKAIGELIEFQKSLVEVKEGNTSRKESIKWLMLFLVISLGVILVGAAAN